MGAPYRSRGKQVLHTVEGLNAHFADAVSEKAAQLIVDALNADRSTLDPYEQPPGDDDLDWQPDYTPPSPTMEMKLSDPPSFFRQDTAHKQRREGDEIVCSCGMRYDAREDHP